MKGAGNRHRFKSVGLNPSAGAVYLDLTAVAQLQDSVGTESNGPSPRSDFMQSLTAK
jgi:hypothetical protein